MNQRIDYEIDPNSSFKKLKTLQISLKEENALKDIFYVNKDELLKKIEKNCYEYYKEKIKIQKIYDNNNSNENINNNNNYSNSKNYLIKENAQSELPQCYDVIYRILFLLRSNNKLLLELIENIDYSNYEIFSNFLCHYFYNNIFSSTYINEYLLVLIYLLLEKEVDKINDNNNSFLDDKSFVSKMLINLSRKLEIKNYMENIIKDIICDIEDDDNINNNNNNNIFFGMKHDVIKNYLDENKFNLMQIKNINNYKEFLFTNIKKSKIYLNNNSQIENNNNNENNNIKNNNNENNNNEEDKIIFDNLTIKQYNTLKNWILSINDQNKDCNFEILFDSNDSSKDFHELCDNQTNTLTLIETKNNFKFGGFTECAWSSNKEEKKDNNSFLFSLDKNKKYIKKDKEKSSIYCNPDYGPFFGSYDKNDIVVKGNIKNGSIKKNGSFLDEEMFKEINGGKSNFAIKNLKVFKINFT